MGGRVCTRECATAWLLAGGGGTAPIVSFSEAVSSVRWGVRVFLAFVLAIHLTGT